jgi:sulfide dehydrogenase cytochrome subunit
MFKFLLIASLLAASHFAHAESGTISPGTGGDTKGQTLPPLSGQPQQALSASLHAFKTGARPSTIMAQIAKGYTDEQIELLAAYFAAQKK